MKRNQFLDSANQKQRFSLRKLSIGTVSVLLGTTLYLGTTTTTAQADTTANNEQATVTTGSDSLNSNEVALQSQNDSSQPSGNSQAASLEQANSTGSATSSAADSSASSSTATLADSDAAADTPAAAPSTEGSATPQQDEEHLLAFDGTDTINFGNKTIKLRFKTSDTKEGDVFKIVIPETGEGFDVTSEYNTSSGYNIAYGDFQGDDNDQSGYGTATLTHDAVKKQWVLTDKVTKKVSFNQPFTITLNDENLNKKILHSTGQFTGKIYLYKNDKQIDEVDYKLNLDAPTIKLKWNNNTFGYDYVTSIYTMDGTSVTNARLNANTDYQWKMNAEFPLEFNHGTTITITMPEHFQLNEELTKNSKYQKNLFDTCHATINQEEDGTVKITIPKSTNEMLANARIHFNTDFSLVGQFRMDVPGHETLLAAGKYPTLTEYTNDQGTTKSYSAEHAPYVYIIGKESGSTNEPQPSALTLDIDPDEYDGSKPVTYIDKAQSHNLNQNISFGAAPYALKNVQATITIPDGMKITEVGTSGNRQPFNYTLHLSDGSTVTGATTSIGAMTEQVSGGKTITSVDIVVDDMGAYKTVGNLYLKGTLDTTKVKVGDKLKTTLTVSAAGMGESVEKSIEQEVVKKAPDPVENNIDVTVDERNTNPGYANAGYIDIHVKKSTAEKLTFNVVLPSNTNLSYVQYLPADGQVEKSINADGRTVLTITGTFKQGGINIWLNNSSLVTEKNEKSDFKVYLGEMTETNLQKASESHGSKTTDGGLWTIMTTFATRTTSFSKGNQGGDFKKASLSTSWGTDELSFENTIVNAQKDTLLALKIASVVPGTWDGKSEYDMALTGPVTVKNMLTQQNVTAGVQNYYLLAESLPDLSTIAKDSDPINHYGFVTADQVTDWSKVRMALTTIDEMPGNDIYGIILSGNDPTFKTDAGKTAWSSSIAWASNVLNPYPVNPGDKDSAKVTIQSISHANLITMVPNSEGSAATDNEIVESSDGGNADGTVKEYIEFKKTDDTKANDTKANNILKKEGYTYQVYYFGESLVNLVNSEGKDDQATLLKKLDVPFLKQTVQSGEVYDSLSDALKAHPKYDDEDDWDAVATADNIAGFYTQNFIVIYTAVAPKQTLYILSDNDPYADNETTKQYALPKTTTEADQSGTGYFKVQGNSADPLIKLEQGEASNKFSESTSWDNGPSLYTREGYYISEVTYKVTDAQGTTHTVTLKVNKTSHYNLENAAGDNVDRQLLRILNFLTTGYNETGGNEATFELTSSGYGADQSPFEIEIDGLDGSSIDTSENHRQLVTSGSSTWVYDETKYDNSNQLNLDPQPQIITLTYASYGDQVASLRFYDDTDEKFIDTLPALSAKGNSNGKISFTIPAGYDFSGYDFVGVTVGTDPQSAEKLDGAQLRDVQYGNFDADYTTDQNFIAHFTHRTAPVEQKYTVTVHYVDENNAVIKDPAVLGADYKDGDHYDAAPAKKSTITFNGQTYDYDKTTGAAESGTINRSNVDVTYVYKLNQPEQPTGPSQPTSPSQPTEPSQPTSPSQPTEPSQPTSPSQPTEPSQPTNPSQPTSPSQPTEPSQPTSPSQPTEPSQPTQPTTVNQPSVPGQEPAAQPQAQQKTTQNKLPQTGNDSSAAVAGMGALLGMFGLLGLGKRKKRD
jgi:LPXTG-motif cell wall-anchored protein